MILYVLLRVRRNAMGREQPVEVARARPVEAELHRGAREARDDACLEVDLQVDHEIERASGEGAANVGERAQALRAIEDDDLVDRAMAAHERRGAGLKNPGDVNVAGEWRFSALMTGSTCTASPTALIMTMQTRSRRDVDHDAEVGRRASIS